MCLFVEYQSYFNKSVKSFAFLTRYPPNRQLTVPNSKEVKSMTQIQHGKDEFQTCVCVEGGRGGAFQQGLIVKKFCKN